jgi:hypothetical protein
MIAWFATSCLVILLHGYTIFEILRDADKSETPIGNLLTWMGVPYTHAIVFGDDQPSRKWLHIFAALGEHSWVNALGWDVIFSLVSLLMCSYVSSPDVGDMVKCTFCPWLDEVVAVVQKGAKDVDEATVGARRDLQRVASPYLDAAQEGFDDFQEAAEPYTRAAIRGTKHAINEAKARSDEAFYKYKPFFESHGLDPVLLVKRAKDGLELGLESVAENARGTVEWVAQELADILPDDDDEDERPRKHSAQSRSRGRGKDEYRGLRGGAQTRSRRPAQDEDEDSDDSGDWTLVQNKKQRSQSQGMRGRPAKSPAPSKSNSSGASRHDEEEGQLRRRSMRLADRVSSQVQTAAQAAREKSRSLASSVPSWYNEAVSAAADIELPEDFPDRTEVMGVALGFWAFGGLGLATTAVLGADTVEY